MKTRTLLARLEEYYVKLINTDRYVCIDERPSKAESLDVKIVGGTDGILDAYKIVTGATEKEARAAYENSGLPYCGHTDEHHGIKGCGYRRKVDSPDDFAKVGAPERVEAEDRFNWIAGHDDAFIPEYQEEHKPVAAVINWFAGTTLDQNKAYEQNLGTFNLDAWALDGLAEALKVDKDKFLQAMIGLFHKTVATLAPGTPILERK